MVIFSHFISIYVAHLVAKIFRNIKFSNNLFFWAWIDARLLGLYLYFIYVGLKSKKKSSFKKNKLHKISRKTVQNECYLPAFFFFWKNLNKDFINLLLIQHLSYTVDITTWSKSAQAKLEDIKFYSLPLQISKPWFWKRGFEKKHEVSVSLNC